MKPKSKRPTKPKPAKKAVKKTGIKYPEHVPSYLILH